MYYDTGTEVVISLRPSIIVDLTWLGTFLSTINTEKNRGSTLVVVNVTQTIQHNMPYGSRNCRRTASTNTTEN